MKIKKRFEKGESVQVTACIRKYNNNPFQGQEGGEHKSLQKEVPVMAKKNITSLGA